MDNLIATGIQLGYVAPDHQDRFFEETKPLFPTFDGQVEGQQSHSKDQQINFQ